MAKTLSLIEQAILREIANVTIVSSEIVLSESLKRSVVFSMPTLRVVDPTEWNERGKADDYAVCIEFKQGIFGENVLLLKQKEAEKIANIMTKEKIGTTEHAWDELHESALQELFNMVVGNMIAALIRETGKDISISTPKAKKGAWQEFTEDVLVYTFTVTVEETKIEMIQALHLREARELSTMLVERWERKE